MLGAILVWTIYVGGGTAWTVFAVAAVVIGLGVVVKYAVPGRRLKEVGIPGSTLVLGAVLGVVGFFVIPVVGLPVGFVLGVYLAELSRVGGPAAWPATVHALKAVGLSMLIEFTASLLAAAVWVTGVVAHVITVLFSLGAALAYGLSDFLGGVISRRTSVWPVAMLACAGAGLGTLVLAFTVPGDPDRRRHRLGPARRGGQRHRHGVPLPRLRQGSDGRGRTRLRGRRGTAPRRDRGAHRRTPEHPRVDRASSPHCPASGWSRANHLPPTPPADRRPGSSTGSSPVPASACSSPPWARSPTAPATGR